MEFWGVEVKPGESVKCEPEDEKYMHLSHVLLGESKDKRSKNVRVFVTFDNRKSLLGTLSQEKCAQMTLDLVFEKGFELSHKSKSASVYFRGYKTSVQYEDCEDSESEEDVQIAQDKKGAAEVVSKQGKPVVENAKGRKEDGSSAKPVTKSKEPVKTDKMKAEYDSDEEDDDEDDTEEESESDKDLNETPSESDDSSSDDDDVATPEATSGKKRQAESQPSSETLALEKKVKFTTPSPGQNSGNDGKKVVDVATPYPAKTMQQILRPFSCMSCLKFFKTEKALGHHNGAKHSGRKCFQWS